LTILLSTRIPRHLARHSAEFCNVYPMKLPLRTTSWSFRKLSL
jgi:hypothetical protein